MVTQGASEPENYVPPTRDLEKRERSGAGREVRASPPGFQVCGSAFQLLAYRNGWVYVREHAPRVHTGRLLPQLDS